MLKCQLHTHVFGDPKDHIKHTPEELIQKAAELKYDVLAITTHKKVIFSEKLKLFAEKKGIILLSGIELQIKGKHVLAINVTQEIENVHSFEDLSAYKNSHPECLIIAPHPFFILGSLMRKKLFKNIHLFDAIEYSFFFTKLINFNKPAEAYAKKYNKPLVATSDCHLLKYMDNGFTLVNAEKSIESIINAIKGNKIETRIFPLGGILKMAKIFLEMLWHS